jgi:hypothetical protein
MGGQIGHDIAPEAWWDGAAGADRVRLVAGVAGHCVRSVPSRLRSRISTLM